MPSDTVSKGIHFAFEAKTIAFCVAVHKASSRCIDFMIDKSGRVMPW